MEGFIDARSSASPKSTLKVCVECVWSHRYLAGSGWLTRRCIPVFRITLSC